MRLLINGVRASKALTLQCDRREGRTSENFVYFPLDFCKLVRFRFLLVLVVTLVPDCCQPHNVTVALVVLELVENWWHFKVFLEHFIHDVIVCLLSWRIQVAIRC